MTSFSSSSLACYEGTKVHTTLVNLYRASLKQDDLLSDTQWNPQGGSAVSLHVKTSSSSSDGDPADPVIGCPSDDRAPSTKKPEAVSNKVSTAQVIRVRQSSLKKQRSMLDKSAKTP
jgi:hypothetical protein